MKEWGFPSKTPGLFPAAPWIALKRPACQS